MINQKELKIPLDQLKIEECHLLFLHMYEFAKQYAQLLLSNHALARQYTKFFFIKYRNLYKL